MAMQNWPNGLVLPSGVFLLSFVLAISVILVTVTALVITSKRLVNDINTAHNTSGYLVDFLLPSNSQDRVPFAAGQNPFAILYQHYRFVIDGPGLINKGYVRFKQGLFEIPRTFRFGQVILCKPELIEGLRTTRSAVASPEPWIDQVKCPPTVHLLLQISHVMPGYFPKGGGWPAIAKTTPGVIRGTVYKELDRYIPSMDQAILSQFHTLQFNDDECSVGCFDFAYSIVARSGSFAMVGSQLSQNEEYLKAVKDHILGMIMTTRVQFLVPDCLKRARYIGGFISHLATLGTRWDMHASRKILLKHFNARAAEYRDEMASEELNHQPRPEDMHKPVEIFRWLYESSVLRQRWSYSEVIGEMLLLQFAFIYTTAYGLYGALAELARRPEYITPLREEVETILTELGPTVAACDRMILLDSFLKECQRLHPPAAVSAHRVCVTPLQLSNGITLKPGTHVGVPSGVIQRSSEYYENPEAFDGFRFVKRAAAGAKDSRFVDLSPEYLVFGMGVHACPGRWMASALMKLVFAHILTRWNVFLPGSSQGPVTGSLSFEEFYVPNFGLKIGLRRRK
ncbi:Cytochrome P450 [Penicillium alfredii]|uniref:Cytochrome P450 n=1 Tax=Penicillium alfredii TaxID=1506179 RepID=A0A9W9F946_9EURO|nr:Cytochrome P450 [Penicillium alfredii]KAJ5095707.1 Cytochrome P450 [Penicillium alfredii]